MKSTLCALLLALVLANDSLAVETIRYFQTEFRYAYGRDVLALALDKTVATRGPYALVGVPEPLSEARGQHMLESGEIDVAFLPSNAEREHRFLPVRNPLMRGILGYRVMLARTDDLARLSGIDSFAALQAESMVFGADWADRPLLEANGFRLVTSPSYELLFALLTNGRGSLFPRGISEAWVELAEKKSEFPGLAVEPRLALYYPYHVFFFVTKGNTALAARLDEGLARAEQDGSFKALFLNYHADIIRQAKLPTRRVFRLTNPDPGSAIAIDTSWWLPQGIKMIDSVSR